MKYGKHPAVRLLTTPAFGDFTGVASTWPTVGPQGWEYTTKPVSLGMLGNGPDPANPVSIPDGVGDCVIAAMMHYAQVETANTSDPLTPTTEWALETYSAITGFKYDDPTTDQGTSYQTQALPHWQKYGIPMLNSKGQEVTHKILGWASLDLTSIAQQRYANKIFGGILWGFNCPQSAEDNTDNWLYDASSPTIGGHAVNQVGQGGAGGHLNSWGLSIPFNWAFMQNLADEAYIVVTPKWVDSVTGKSPSGLDLTGLLAAMRAM